MIESLENRGFESLNKSNTLVFIRTRTHENVPGNDSKPRQLSLEKFGRRKTQLEGFFNSSGAFFWFRVHETMRTLKKLFDCKSVITS